MGAKQSEETRLALKLHKSGKSVYEAAKLAGVWPTTLYKVLKDNKKKKLAKTVA